MSLPINIHSRLLVSMFQTNIFDTSETLWANAGPTLIWSHDMKSCVRTCNDHARTGVLVMQSGNYKQTKELMNLTCLAWLYGVQGKGMIPQCLVLSWKSRRKLEDLPKHNFPLQAAVRFLLISRSAGSLLGLNNSHFFYCISAHLSSSQL